MQFARETIAGNTNAHVAARTLGVLHRILEGESVEADLDVALYDSGMLDSLKTVELILAFSEEFGIEISPAEFERERWASPRKIISDMRSRIGG